jgi:hypothetical protein
MAQGVQEMLEPHIDRLMANHEWHARGYIAKRGGPEQKPLRLHRDYSFVDHEVHRAIHGWVPLAEVDAECTVPPMKAGEVVFFDGEPEG